MSGRVVRLEENLGEIPASRKIVVGFDEVFFAGKEGVEGAVEAAVVRMRLRDLLAGNYVTACGLMPPWFKNLVAKYKLAHESDPEAPSNFTPMMSLFKKINDAMNDAVADKDPNGGVRVLDGIMELDKMMMEWVKWFFKRGIDQPFFVERARWFDGLSYVGLDRMIRDNQADLPGLRQNVVDFVVNMRQSYPSVEVVMITGTTREVVERVLGLYPDLVDLLGLSGIYASSRGRAELSSGEGMILQGAKALTPREKCRVVEQMGDDVRVAVLAMRNCGAPYSPTPPDPVAAKVLANGGCVVAIGTRKLEN